MISWSYLDKKDATIRAMKDYDAMKFIIENTSDEIKQISEKMTSVGVPKYDDHVRSGNVHAGEDSVINRLEEMAQPTPDGDGVILKGKNCDISLAELQKRVLNPKT